jgi:hypothetical protein
MYTGVELAQYGNKLVDLMKMEGLRGGSKDNMNARDREASRSEGEGHAVLEVFVAAREDGGWEQQPVVIPSERQVMTASFKVFSSRKAPST